MRSVLLVVPIFLFAITTKPWLGAADSASDLVLDFDCKKVRTGADYYILPAIRGRGGGLALASTRSKTCPLHVVQERHEVSKGLPLTFSPVNQKKGGVRVSTDLNVNFSAATICVQSTVWNLDKFDDSIRHWFVTTGGVKGNPGRETTSNWFKIEKYEDRYKLVFCPTVCNFYKVLCKDVGIYIEDGRRHLALRDVPFMVMFKKV